MNGKTCVCLHMICMPLPSFAQLALANKFYFWKQIVIWILDSTFWFLSVNYSISAQHCSDWQVSSFHLAQGKDDDAPQSHQKHAMNSPVPLWQVSKWTPAFTGDGNCWDSPACSPYRTGFCSYHFPTQSMKGKVDTFRVNEIVGFEKTKVILEQVLWTREISS